MNYDPRLAAERYIGLHPQSSGPEKIITTEALLTAVEAAFLKSVKENDILFDLQIGYSVYSKVPEKYQKYSKGIQQTGPFSIIENLGNLEYVLAIEGSDPK